MLTTYDRYVLARTLHAFGAMLVAAYGLFVVFDLFTNVDDFQQGAGSVADLLLQIAAYYGWRSFEFFELAGPMLIVVAVVTTLALLRRHSETFPLLAAGIPTFRLLQPLAGGAVLLNVALIVNQEIVLPAIAVPLQTPRGSATAQEQKVEPVYDYSNALMHIDGERVLIHERALVDASFALPTPELVIHGCQLKAERAVFLDPFGRRPSGWLLQNLTGVFDPDVLTAAGRSRVFPAENGHDVFIASEVTFDQLYNRGRNLKLLSTWQLLQRIRNPATGPVPVRGQSLALHARLTRPVLSLLSICIAVPLVLRRESASQIMNLMVCAVVLGSYYALTQCCLAIGGSGLVAPDLAAWVPVVIGGIASAWTSGLVQT
jgi:lipopolysaccharide export system permease protein